MSTETFEIRTKDSRTSARTGVLNTAHGPVETPVFMPVGTAGAVKGVTPYQLSKAGASILLANTYHLMIRPGVEVVAELGGLHKLMAWQGPILTDSGGYQVFSLDSLNRVNDDGVEFASHVDGKKFQLTPESATKIQNRLGADIIMCLDQCTPFPCAPKTLEEAVKRTLQWAKICRDTHDDPDKLLFGIVQGGIDPYLRSKCVAALVEIGFDGYAIGGLSVGEGHQNMVKTVGHTTESLPKDKPRYLMGVGTPADIIAAVAEGVDMFDCVLPTRNGRNAFAFTQAGPMRMRNSVYTNDPEPIEQGCDCYCCRNFSRGAIRHFFNINEMLGPILVSIHNITFYQRLMKRMRESINGGFFYDWANESLRKYEKFGFKKRPNNSANYL